MEMQILAFDPYVDPAAITESGVEPLDLPTLLDRSDVVSLHARATATNQRLIGAAEFERMKSGATFINTARDTLVDEAALLKALDSGRLAGAALDVVSSSPPGRERHPLLGHPNVIISTHIGGATSETLRRGAEMAIAEIDRFLDGKQPVSVTNRDELAARSPTSDVP
jgi:D-3-phosphoglycerate dehydrogenase